MIEVIVSRLILLTDFSEIGEWRFFVKVSGSIEISTIGRGGVIEPVPAATLGQIGDQFQVREIMAAVHEMSNNGRLTREILSQEEQGNFQFLACNVAALGKASD